MPVIIHDTTLRDGEQAAGAAFQQGTATPSAFGLRQAERSEKMLDEIGILQILVLSGPQT